MSTRTIALGAGRGIGWYVNRLRCMSAPEVLARSRHALLTALKARSHSQPLAARPPQQTRFGQPWFAGCADHGRTEEILRQADAALRGAIPVLALADACLGSPPQWNRDPRTGVTAPLAFGLRMDAADRARVGDIKYLWEPSRHHHLVPVAQAYALSADERWLDGLAGLVESWIDQCPYPLGPHWMSPLEAGVRLINWSIAWHLSGAGSAQGPWRQRWSALRAKWLDAIYWHIRFILENLSAHSSANNHLIGELAGAFVGLSTWPCWRELTPRRDAVWRRLVAEAMRQNGEDGVNREQAVSYQQFVFDFLLIAALCAQRNGVVVPAPYWRRLEAMLEFLAALMDVEGNVPQIGDGDDARACGFASTLDNYRSILATGALLFSRPALARAAGALDAKTCWLLGDDKAAEFTRLRDSTARDQTPRAFRDGGYYVLGQRFGCADEIKAIFDAGPLGYLSIAAHGHADGLSLLLSVAGEPVLIDPGTLSYHGPLAWREHFRGTHAHNTLVVDDRCQSLSGGRFMWLRHADASCTEFSLHEDIQVAAGRHDGYAGGGSPAHHARRVEFVPAQKRLIVTDRIDGAGGHEVAAYWHFGATIQARLEGSRCLLEGERCRIVVHLPDGDEHQLIRAQEEAPMGWISPSYDRRLPGLVLVSSYRGSVPLQRVTEMQISIRG